MGLVSSEPSNAASALSVKGSSFGGSRSSLGACMMVLSEFLSSDCVVTAGRGGRARVRRRTRKSSGRATAMV